MDASGDPSQGNIRGLPDVQTRDELTKVLTSLLYRVNAHGGGTLTPSVNPVLGFVANFPPCLQNADIPEPGTPCSGPAGAPAAYRYVRRDDDLLLHVRLLASERAADPERGITADPYFPPSTTRATRRCSSSDRTSRTSSTRTSRTGTWRLRGTGETHRDRCRRMPKINTGSGRRASSSEPLRFGGGLCRPREVTRP